MLWDLNARNHEITLLRIKNIRIKEKYGEGEVPYEAKTGSGPILLTLSFPYVRDWLNEHPFRSEPEARLICNPENGKSLLPGAIFDTMYLLKKKIIRFNNKKFNKNAFKCLKVFLNSLKQIKFSLTS